MKELQKKQRIRRVMYSIPSLLALSIITFFLVKGALRVIDKERESSKRSADWEERLEGLSLREQVLQQNIAKLQTEEGIKDEMRGRFSVTEEGEYVAVIVDDRLTSTSTDDLSISWYRRLWNVIMKIK